MERKRLLQRLVVLCLVTVGSVTVFAQLKLGYVNSQKILLTYPAAIDAQKKLDAENNKWGQELQKMEEEFKSIQETLEQQSLLLSDAKKQERQQELQNLYVNIQQFQNEKWGENGEFFTRKEEFFLPIIEKINTAIHKIGEEGEYDFVFDAATGNILHTKEEKYDLTDQILEELEKETSKSSTQSGG